LNESLVKSPNSTSLQQLFGEADDDFWFWLNTEGVRESDVLRSLIPALPSEEMQIQTIGSAGDTALLEAFNAWRLFKSQFQRHTGQPISEKTRVLDFGCGWGRFLRFFLKDAQPMNLWGFDPSPERIQACRATNPRCQFVQSALMPPTPITDGFFDLIYCYSIFSHLSEDAHKRWLKELHRLLRPGGILIATTWQRDHIARSESLRQLDPKSLSEWHKELTAIWVDGSRWLKDYDSGRFCYQPYSSDGHSWSYLDGVSFYGEACIPKDYVISEWGKTFEFLDFIDDRELCSQNVAVVRRRS
jgi:SAM-dependent methyltransferase